MRMILGSLGLVLCVLVTGCNPPLEVVEPPTEISAEEERLRAISKDPARIEAGREIYFAQAANCTLCHGRDGLGKAPFGPNLRDDRWKYGSMMEDIIKTIRHGVASSGSGGNMPPIGSDFTDEQVESLAAFLADWNRTQRANGQGHTVKGEKIFPITY